jgi:excisionase family DNA binding protein
MTQLLTAREVADRVSVSTETILRWTRRGELAAIRLPGGALRYREDILEQWLDTRGTLPGTPTERPRAASTAGGMAHEENAS